MKACAILILSDLDILSNGTYDRHIFDNMIQETTLSKPPLDPAVEDGPDAVTAPLSGGPPVRPEEDYEILADAEEEDDDD